MREYIEERAVEIANYIIENNATVRQTAKQFRISKSTVHMVVTKKNCIEILYIWLNYMYYSWVKVILISIFNSFRPIVDGLFNVSW